MITQDELKSIVNYDPDTGAFTWLNDMYSPGNGYRRKKGDTIDSKVGEGYLGVSIYRTQYRLHHLAFLYMKGYIPKEVDHDNGIRTDNKWNNLIECDRSKNMRNRRIGKYNTSGVIGVSFRADTMKWSAYINSGPKREMLGCFFNIEDAIKARKDAEKKHGFNPNHGREL
jgi:hypothetical protein